jgi:hypothetical protein
VQCTGTPAATRYNRPAAENCAGTPAKNHCVRQGFANVPTRQLLELFWHASKEPLFRAGCTKLRTRLLLESVPAHLLLYVPFYRAKKAQLLVSSVQQDLDLIADASTRATRALEN